ncbi:aspartate aminotransferase family protein [Amycolatopsis pigmentata]|uniref:Aspartate aminotransferase family protein n=1 Tax=Amycolatopsis pigmentata TaxID=450801 RepID=A0ABW5G4K2_9PSEU
MHDLISVDECERLSISEVHDLYRRHVGRSQVSLMSSFSFGRELVAEAEGVWIHTRGGRRILDFTGGVGVLGHGHNHSQILAARREFQARGGLESHHGHLSPYVAVLSHNLAQLLPADLSVCRFVNSGAEAVEEAIKLAYRFHRGRRRHILHSDISFHGKLLGSGSVTGAAQHAFAFPRISGVLSYTYDDIESVRAAIDSCRKESGECDVYAILVEPFSASTMRHCSEGFLRELRELCTAEDILLLFDEIYTGWGKTGSLFAFLRYPGLVPDLLTTSKSFGGGKSSISGYVARESVCRIAGDDSAEPGMTEEIATAIEAVRIAVDDDYPGRGRTIERQIAAGLGNLAEKYPRMITDVAGSGALFGVFLGGPRILGMASRIAPGGLGRDPNFGTKLMACAVVDALYRDHGVYSYYTLNGRNPLVVAPSLVVEQAEIDYFMNALDRTLAKGPVRLLAEFVKSKAGSLW